MKSNFEFSACVGKRRKAFTLIEILIVMSILIMLTGISVAVVSGVFDNQGRAKARADMEVMATGLEGFCGQYGGYPRLNAGTGEKFVAGQIYKCLVGRMMMKVQNGSIVMIDLMGTRSAFVDSARLTIGDPNDEYATNVDPERAGVFFADPWHEPYLYFYDNSVTVGSEGRTWRSPGFILLSKGADQKAANVQSMYSTGIIPDDEDYTNSEENLDNIVQGRDI